MRVVNVAKDTFDGCGLRQQRGRGCVSYSDVKDNRPEQARQAPNLAGFSERERVAGVLPHNKENIKKWLKDPEKVKPGNKMSGTYPDLTDEQVNELADYLMSLKEK